MDFIITGAVIVLVAGLIQGCTGFGFALVSVPILVLFLPYNQVPPMVVILSMASNITVLIDSWRSVRLRVVLPLLIGALLGLPVGGYILLHINHEMFKILVGAIVLILALVLLAGWKRKVRNETIGMLPVGFISGVLSNSTAMGGPPLVLYFSNQDVEKRHFRANIVAYFMLVNLGAIFVFYIMGLMKHTVLVNAGIYFIPAVIGSVTGVRLAKYINENFFKKVVLVVVGILGLILVLVNIPH
jgi:uncharacterized membrane protein YfcA